MNRVSGTLKKDISGVASSLIWVKIIGVGDIGTGKTCIIKHFCESNFSPVYQATVGVDYGFKIQKVGDFDLRVHLWDFSGAPEYFEIRNELYANTDGVFLVFDICNAASFDDIHMWLQEINRFTAADSPEIILVGNKSDLSAERAVTSADARKLAQRLKLTYIETSTAKGENINKLFTELLEKVVAKKSLSWKTKILQKPASNLL